MVIELAGDVAKRIRARPALAVTVSKNERMSSSLEAPPAAKLNYFHTARPDVEHADVAIIQKSNPFFPRAMATCGIGDAMVGMPVSRALSALRWPVRRLRYKATSAMMTARLTPAAAHKYPV
jgi:hypothetical protein